MTNLVNFSIVFQGFKELPVDFSELPERTGKRGDPRGYAEWSRSRILMICTMVRLTGVSMP